MYVCVYILKYFSKFLLNVNIEIYVIPKPIEIKPRKRYLMICCYISFKAGLIFHRPNKTIVAKLEVVSVVLLT